MVAPPMTQPDELRKAAPLLWSSGIGTDVWKMLWACAQGDLAHVKLLLEKDPTLARCHYAYRTPIYFAVRENRLTVAEYLLDHGADPLSLAVNHSLLDIARHRGYAEMQALLEDRIARLHRASGKSEPIAAAIRNRDIARMRQLL